MVVGSSPVSSCSHSDFAPPSSKEFLDIQAAIECVFTLKRVRDMIRIYSRPEILRRVCKVYKAIIDVFPPFRHILSAIGTPSYRLTKFLVPKLYSITFNEFTVKDYFAFAK